MSIAVTDLFASPQPIPVDWGIQLVDVCNGLSNLSWRDELNSLHLMRTTNTTKAVRRGANSQYYIETIPGKDKKSKVDYLIITGEHPRNAQGYGFLLHGFSSPFLFYALPSPSRRLREEAYLILDSFSEEDIRSRCLLSEPVGYIDDCGNYIETVPMPPYYPGISLLKERPLHAIDFPPASFSPNNSYPIKGTLLSHCLKVKLIYHGDRPVFEREELQGIRQIKVAILWPGYGSDGFIRGVDVPLQGAHGVLTRSELAHRVASEYQRFIMDCDVGRIPDLGSYYKVGRNDINLNDMILDYVWSPDVDV
ncbi:uncharacterized protein LAESUDRAFT_812662 [Laetiporus sulphureus 93-53]|uniref:Uncharacterized protein n=1 Tax=Laetiporus sulphureus 93-53 TaxID=1314785 RepID=A0A165EC77_9APHY|nr:uncharacterized protein LAESUDRAFT_812662 [Laetiporus sulphureus 93-53]KZT06711.1 hypothetical protein LAESUDRAFT_812662 [Laetiporus sulphureus 93-53]